jgi:hypothetical protein
VAAKKTNKSKKRQVSAHSIEKAKKAALNTTLKEASAAIGPPVKEALDKRKAMEKKVSALDREIRVLSKIRSKIQQKVYEHYGRQTALTMVENGIKTVTEYFAKQEAEKQRAARAARMKRSNKARKVRASKKSAKAEASTKSGSAGVQAPSVTDATEHETGRRLSE